MAFLEITEHAHHLEWQLNRPERGNALGITLAGELCAALTHLKASLPKDKALVITAKPLVKGAARTWIAGGDLKELAQLQEPREARHYADLLGGFLDGLDELPLPVIVAVDGAAIGGGAELALAGDVRIATKASTLAFKQLRVGLATGYGSARRLYELIGKSRTQGLLYLGETLTAKKAMKLGLIHRLVETSIELETATAQLAEELVALGSASFAGQKQMLRIATRAHPGSTREAELDLFQAMWRNPAHTQFLDDFLARHPDTSQLGPSRPRRS